MVKCIYWINYRKTYSKAAVYVNELVLTPFSPSDIKCKKLMRKTSGNAFLGHLGEWDFHIFPSLHSMVGSICRYFFEFLWIMLQYSVQALSNIKDGALWQNISDSWKLLLAVVTKSFVVNVTGFQDPTMKHIDKFRLKQ